jgi:hypothetical protein
VEDSSFEEHGRLIEQYGEGRAEKYKLPYEGDTGIGRTCLKNDFRTMG